MGFGRGLGVAPWALDHQSWALGRGLGGIGPWELGRWLWAVDVGP